MFRLENPLVDDYQLEQQVHTLPECPIGNRVVAEMPLEYRDGESLRIRASYNFTVSLQLNTTSLVETIGGGIADTSFVSKQGPRVAVQIIACDMMTLGFCSPYNHDEAIARKAAQGITEPPVAPGDTHGGTHVHSEFLFLDLPTAVGPIYNVTMQLPMVVNTAGVYYPIAALQLFFRDYFGIYTRYDIANAMPIHHRLVRYQEQPTILRVSPTIRRLVFALVSLVSAVIIFLLYHTIKHLEHQVMLLTQGSFLAMFLLAALGATAATFLLEPRNDVYCRTGLPLVLVTTQLLHAITLGRLWRVNAVSK